MIKHCLVAIVLLCACRSWGADRYPLHVSADHRYLVDREGTPFLVQGDAAWSLISGLTDEEADKYLEARRRQGFNSIIVNLIEHHFRGPVDRYGQNPFTTPGDFSTPNEKYFEHADRVIRKAQEKGIVVFLAPIYLGYVGTEEGWIEELGKNGPEKSLAWGRFVGARYRSFDNIVWIIGGDRNPASARKEVDAVAKGIKETADRHLLTAHCHPENSALDQYSGEGWLDLNDTYTYRIVHEMLSRDYGRTPVMPFFLIESTYEGEHNASEVQIRRQAYWAVLLGSTGQFMGNLPIWRFGDGWEKVLDSQGAEDMSRLFALFATRPWFDLVPDQTHEVVTNGLGEFNGMDYLTASRAKDGSTIVAYMPTARTVTVDLKKLSGKDAAAWWFNPRTGKATKAGKFPNDGPHAFKPPAEGDWVLVVDDASRNLPAPGSK